MISLTPEALRVRVRSPEFRQPIALLSKSHMPKKSDLGLGDLICIIILASHRAWSISGWQNLYIFRHGLVSAAGEWTSAKEMAGALPSPFEGSARTRRAGADAAINAQRRHAEHEASLMEFLKRHPDATIIRWRNVETARLRKGVVDSRLVLSLDDGTELRWVWGRGGRFRMPNATYAQVEAALRDALGSKLVRG